MNRIPLRALAAAALTLTMVACGSPTPVADAEPTHPPLIVVRNSVEVLFDYDATGIGSSSAGTDPVYSQCDNHGHRVFIQRHPQPFWVVSDPSCPGGKPS